jgi:hypothetical protein
VAQNHKAIEQPECNRRRHEEIDCRDAIDMIGQKGPPPVDAENSVRRCRNVWDGAVYCERMAATVLDADAKARAGDQKVNGSSRSGNHL